MLSGRQKQQLLYSRFINVHGREGRNISCDLFMEHLNRQLKDGIRALGPNKTENAISRLAKSIAPLADLLANFDSIEEVNNPSGNHKRLNCEKDMNLVIKELQGAKVFCSQAGRCHGSFPKFTSILSSLKEKEVKEEAMG